jgi:hypothetical protein
MAQVDHLPSKRKTLNSTLNTIKGKKKKKVMHGQALI